MPVRIGDTQLPFLLDTGFSITAIDSSLTLGSTPRPQIMSTGGADTTVGVVPAPPMTLGPLKMQPAVGSVAALDLQRIRQAIGYDVFGIIGMDFLSNHVIQLDMENRELLFISDAHRAIGRQIKLHYKRSLPFVPVEIAGQRHNDVLIDTGLITQGSGTVTSDAARELESRGRARFIGTKLSETAAGPIKNRVIQADSIDLGGFQIRLPVFQEGNADRLGMRYLSRYTATFDFPHGLVYLHETKTFGQADKSGICGLQLIRKDQRIIVHSIDEDSPASRAGLQAGDEILELNGNDRTNESSLFELRELMSQSGSTIRIVGTRRGNNFSATLIVP